MEPVGMMKASTTYARKMKARMKAITMDSMVSLMDSLFLVGCAAFDFVMNGAGWFGAFWGMWFLLCNRLCDLAYCRGLCHNSQEADGKSVAGRGDVIGRSASLGGKDG